MATSPRPTCLAINPTPATLAALTPTFAVTTSPLSPLPPTPSPFAAIHTGDLAATIAPAALFAFLNRALAPNALATVPHPVAPGALATTALQHLLTEALRHAPPATHAARAAEVAALWAATQPTLPPHLPPDRAAQAVTDAIAAALTATPRTSLPDPLPLAAWIHLARSFGLTYVGDATPEGPLDPDLAALLATIPESIRAAQYSDFITNNHHRTSILRRDTGGAAT